jgi:ferrous iron transport protein A
LITDNAHKLTLAEAKVGRTYTLVGCDAGQQLKEKVYSMGLNSGAHLRIINNSGHGPVGLEVKQTKLGIGRGMAGKIWVREVES